VGKPRRAAAMPGGTWPRCRVPATAELRRDWARRIPCWVRRSAARPLPDVHGVPLRRLPDRLEQRADQAGGDLL